MPITASISSEQTIEIGTNGPDDVTSMYVVTGLANANLSAFSPAGGSFQSQQATFSVHVGPSLTASEFRRAVASASLASLSISGGDASFADWAVTGVDADFDDEAGKVELEFDLRVRVDAGAASSAQSAVAGVGFQVMILTAESE